MGVPTKHTGMQTPPDSDTEATECIKAAAVAAPLWPMDLLDLPAAAVAFEVAKGQHLLNLKYGRKHAAPADKAHHGHNHHHNHKHHNHHAAKEAQISLGPIEAAEVQAAALSIMARLACDFEAAFHSTSAGEVKKDNHHSHHHHHHKHHKNNHKEAKVAPASSFDPVHAAEVHAASAAIISRVACDLEAAHYAGLLNTSSAAPAAPAAAVAEKSAIKTHNKNDFVLCTGEFSSIDVATVNAALYAGKLSIAAKMGQDIEGHWIERVQLQQEQEQQPVEVAEPKVVKLRTMVIKVAEPAAQQQTPKTLKTIKSIDAMRGQNWPVFYEGPWEFPTGQTNE
ncbi:hypothetical protein BDR26DRAFT_884200 [Obelidium mucronatum]|nr:hypothetical protein BDR26DRAFT_884200 [Obelidium mucronatum]